MQQPLTMVRVANSRVPSSEASRWTLKRRTNTIAKVRSIESAGDSSAQLASEIKSLSKEEREQLLSEAQLPIYIPPDHALALKSDLSIPWNKLRTLARYRTYTHHTQKVCIPSL